MLSNKEFNFLITNTIEEIAEQTNEFNKLLFWFLGLLSFGLIIAVFIQVRFGLRPLKRIQSSLSSIRLGKAKFLGKHFPFEIRPLVREINSLLKHNSEVLVRTRMHVGNLAHSLKTPLSVLSNDLKKKDYKFSKNLVGEKITPKNTIFYVCGWQGTVDGVLNFVRPLGFLLEKEKDKAKDGNFSVKFESYG